MSVSKDAITRETNVAGNTITRVSKRYGNRQELECRRDTAIARNWNVEGIHSLGNQKKKGYDHQGTECRRDAAIARNYNVEGIHFTSEPKVVGIRSPGNRMSKGYGKRQEL